MPKKTAELTERELEFYERRLRRLLAVADRPRSMKKAAHSEPVITRQAVEAFAKQCGYPTRIPTRKTGPVRGGGLSVVMNGTLYRYSFDPNRDPQYKREVIENYRDPVKEARIRELRDAARRDSGSAEV